MIYLTRKMTFSAAHRLNIDSLPPEENKKLFGKCNNPNFHGHNYVIETTLCGEPDPQTGMIINLVDLKNIIQKRLIDVLDHSNLNTDVPFLKGKNPTAENIADACWKELEPEFGDLLYEVKIYESENNSASRRRQ